MTGSKVPCKILMPRFTLVIGGARSGKSGFAEGLATSALCPRRYIATAQGWDDEMRDRIAQHRLQRGENWVTVDAPLDAAAALATARDGEIVLLDCATLWLSNHLLADADLDAQSTGLLDAIRTCPAPVIVVSNEVGWSIVPDNALARRFRDAQGRLNQRMAGDADLVVAVIAGLPLLLKGAMPGAQN